MLSSPPVVPTPGRPSRPDGVSRGLPTLEPAAGSDIHPLPYDDDPRPYDDVRASQDEASIRQLMRTAGLRFIVVANARQYDPTSWLRQPRDWLRRIDFDAERYLLEVVA